MKENGWELDMYYIVTWIDKNCVLILVIDNRLLPPDPHAWNVKRKEMGLKMK